MLRFLLQRLTVATLVLVCVSMIAFSLAHLSGDPAVAIAGEGATREGIETIRREFGFDRPILVQYASWMGNVLSGEFGRSHYLKESVGPVLASHLSVTLTLGLLSLLFAVLLAIPMGILAALYPNSLIDRIALTVAVIGQSMPSFVVAYLLIYVFGVKYGLLPISGSTTWLHFVLPTLTLGYYATPALMRLTRAGMLDTLQSDFVRTARAKGLREYKVVIRHALRNALAPIIALAAVQLGFMLGGSIVVETIFSLNGIGHLAWQSIQRSDFEVIQAIVLVIAVLYSALMLAADLLNALVDPRVALR